MYVKRIEIQQFRCFEHVEASFHYPGRKASDAFPNLTLVLGDNGAGKSSLLKAIALGILGTVLPSSGFRPYQLVRARRATGVVDGFSDIRVQVELEPDERHLGDEDYTFRTVIKRFGSGDFIFADNTYVYVGPDAAPAKAPDSLHERNAPTFFLCGYGSSRRSEEASTYDEAARLKSRTPRYQRVAGLFEEGYTLTSFSPWLSKMTSDRGRVHPHFEEVLGFLDQLLATSEVRWNRSHLDGEAEFKLLDDGALVLFSALSDGYRAYLAWVGDLLRQLSDVTPHDRKLADATGVVMVDEVDLHLHPSWQRRLLGQLSRTFPKLQFIVTSHSPILAASVPRENVLVVERSADGPARIDWPDKEYYGRTMDEVLTGEYFELETTLPPELEQVRQEQEERRIGLARKLERDPSPEAAEAYLRELTSGWSE